MMFECFLDGPRGIFVSGSYVYTTSDDEEGVEIIDISNPANPIHTGSINDVDCDALNSNECNLNGAFKIFVSGNYAYITSNVEDGLGIIDISNPANPIHAGSILETLEGPMLLDNPIGIFVSGNYAYVPSYTDNGLEILGPLQLGDKSGYKNNGSIQGDAHQVDGFLGKGFEFDGNGDYLDIIGEVIPDGSSEYTICSWFNLGGGVGTDRQIFESSGNDAFGCKVNGGNGLICCINTGSGSCVGLTLVNLNTWYSVCSVYDSGFGTVDHYLNGDFSVSSAISGSLAPTDGFHIGTNALANGNWFNGTIDDVMVFNRSLSEEEIKALYAGSSDSYDNPENKI